jgi:hypothetical protein
MRSGRRHLDVASDREGENVIQRNVGGLDRQVRLVLGTILLLAGLFLLGGLHGNGTGLIVAVIGFLGLATGASGFCVLYVPLGISSARGKKEALLPRVD